MCFDASDYFINSEKNKNEVKKKQFFLSSPFFVKMKYSNKKKLFSFPLLFHHDG